MPDLPESTLGEMLQCCNDNPSALVLYAPTVSALILELQEAQALQKQSDIDEDYLLKRAEAAEAERDRLRAALEKILGLLPSSGIIEDLRADKGYGFRKYQLTRPLVDNEIIELRTALTVKEEGKNAN